MKKITQKLIINFKNYLINEEKSDATLEKYIRDVYAFLSWLDGRGVNKQVVLEYKGSLLKTTSLQVSILLFRHSIAFLAIMNGTIPELNP